MHLSQIDLAWTREIAKIGTIPQVRVGFLARGAEVTSLAGEGLFLLDE